MTSLKRRSDEALAGHSQTATGEAQEEVPQSSSSSSSSSMSMSTAADGDAAQQPAVAPKRRKRRNAIFPNSMGAKMVRNAADLHFAKQRAAEQGTELTTEEKALCGLHDQLAALSAPEVDSSAAEVLPDAVPESPDATASEQPPPAPSEPAGETQDGDGDAEGGNNDVKAQLLAMMKGLESGELQLASRDPMSDYDGHGPDIPF